MDLAPLIVAVRLRPQGSGEQASLVEMMVNQMEAATGVDIDGDGDVGLAGHYVWEEVDGRVLRGD